MDEQNEEPLFNASLLIALGGVLLVIYSHRFLSAVQISMGTGRGSYSYALSKLPAAVPFGVLAVWLLISVYRPSVQAGRIAQFIAGALLTWFAFITLGGLSSFG